MNGYSSDKRSEVLFTAFCFVVVLPLPIALVGYWQVAALMFVGVTIYLVTNPVFSTKDKPTLNDVLRRTNEVATAYIEGRPRPKS